MRVPRLYCNTELNLGEIVTLPKTTSHYITKVLRLSNKDKLILFNGKNKIYSATIQEAKKEVVVHVDSLEEQNNESSLSIHLYQGISKGSRMDTVMQKAVELGVTEITPVFTERCEVKLDAKRLESKLEHWQKIIESACEQSIRNTVPVLNTATKLDENTFDNNALTVVLNPYGTSNLKKINIDSNKQINLLIGPEGGFTEQEIQNAINNGAIDTKLGPRVLRTETAALAAITALQALYGDLT